MKTRAITKVKRNASHSAIPARGLARRRRLEVPQLVGEASTSAERLRSGLQAEPRFRYDFSEISYERRSGYRYHGTWAASLIVTEYPAWRQKHKLP